MKGFMQIMCRLVKCIGKSINAYWGHKAVGGNRNDVVVVVNETINNVFRCSV
jgi:hypothetical protein